MVREYRKCHTRSTHTIVQNQGHSGVSHPDRGYDLFVTAATGDGVRMWDTRSSGDTCVQRYDSVVSGRHQVGVDLSPCMQYLATGSEDGHVYVYDTRHVRSHVSRVNTGGEVVTDVSFSPGHNQLVAVTLEGILATFTNK